MAIFDPHIHMYSRVTDDYEKMAAAGITTILEPAFWLGGVRRHAGTFFDYFEHILGFETERAAKYGIQHYVAIAVNPKEANDLKLAEVVLERLPQYLAHPRCVAVGEIGFDSITDAEERIFKAQAQLAQQHGLPLLIHLPHRNKPEGVRRTIAACRDLDLDPERVLIDHNTEETIAACRQYGCWAGHTVYPVTKLSPERATAIFQEHGIERMLVNSSADWGPSDPLSVVHTIAEMRRRGFSAEQIKTVTWDNPLAFYSQSGRMAAAPPLAAARA